MFYWKKKGRIFNPYLYRNDLWLYEYSQAPCTLIFDDFVRVYFSCRPKRDDKGQFISRSAYIDLDRKNLFAIKKVSDKPVIDLGGRGCFDECGTYPFSVIRRNDEIFAFFAGWSRCQSVPFNTSIGLAISLDDGMFFQRIGNGPVLSSWFDEPFLISGPKIRKFNDIFYLFYIYGERWIEQNSTLEMCLTIRMASSMDLLNWKRTGHDLILKKYNNESQASPDVFYHNGKYHMFFCFWNADDFRVTKKRRIGYASSYDLISWERDDSKAGIDVSASGFDSEMIAYPHVFELDGKIYMLYLGNDVGREGFGLAELVGDLE